MSGGGRSGGVNGGATASSISSDKEQHFARIIRLYYLTMSHKPLYACLRVLFAQTGMNPNNSALHRSGHQRKFSTINIVHFGVNFLTNGCGFVNKK